MQLNVETAVRICHSPFSNNDMIYVQSNPVNNTIHLADAQVCSVNYALPVNCCQNVVFTTAVAPLLNYMLEGCDVSVVTFGQSGTGKTYTIFGPSFHHISSEAEYGIIQRFVQELFTKMKLFRDRQWSVQIAWSQICGDNAQDLLGVGMVECMNINEVIQVMQCGMLNITPKCAHTIFTVTLKQELLLTGAVQHRVSTASFADLAGSEKVSVCDSNGRIQMIPTDPGLQNLHRCIMALSESSNMQSTNCNFVPYNQSVLTTLLKDSFGGRAKTLFLCCVSPFVRDCTETLYTLQLALRAQMIKNFVTVNSYTTIEACQENYDAFGLKFATNLLFKLVLNASELFERLVSSSLLSKSEENQISQWLTLKQELEDCLSESSELHHSLERIEEEVEESSGNESGDEDEEEDDREEKEMFQGLTDNFQEATNRLVTKVNTADVILNFSTKEFSETGECSNHNLNSQENVKTNLLDSSIENSNRRNSSDSKVVALLNNSSNTLSSSFSLGNDSVEYLRHEIRNLRRIRDQLLEERFRMNSRSRSKKSINGTDEQELIENEQTIELIDMIIEYRNCVMCDHQPLLNTIIIDEQTDKMFTERLLKLPESEVRVLLHKYFRKLIDLRGSSKKLEMKMLEIENQQESLTDRIQYLKNTLKQVLFDEEKRVVVLQRQQEEELHKIISHFSGITGVQGRVPEELQATTSTVPQATVIIKKKKIVMQQRYQT